MIAAHFPPGLGGSSRLLIRMSVRMKCLSPRPMAMTRLLCLAHAGGGATPYRSWPKLLPERVEAYAAQLPGREDRLGEPPIREWNPMMTSLIAAVAELPPLRTAIFGHSLGAVVGLELARWMEREQPNLLVHLFVAGRAWPGDSAGRRIDASTLSDNELLQAMDAQYGSLSSSLTHPEIREIALPSLRADLELLDSYRYDPSDALSCPLTVFGGTRDPATTPEKLASWSRETKDRFRLRMFQGSHFFIESEREQLVAEISSGLTQSPAMP